MAASRVAHVAILSSALTSILLFLLLLASVYNAPRSALRYPKHRLLQRPPSSQPQRSQLSVTKQEEPVFRQREVLAVTGDLLTESAGFRSTQESGGEEAREEGEIDYRMTTTVGAGEPVKSWPDLVGIDAEEAKKKILETHSSLQVHILPVNSMVTMDYRRDRVRIFKDGNEKVAGVPQLG